ncbi:UDP-N-acetylglucosamine transferase subunit ALG13 [Tanacetum coccineum]
MTAKLGPEAQVIVWPKPGDLVFNFPGSATEGITTGVSCDDDEVRVVVLQSVCRAVIVEDQKTSAAVIFAEVKKHFRRVQWEDSYHQGTGRIEKFIRHQRVLLVIDDVDSDKQLKILGMNRVLFGRGTNKTAHRRKQEVQIENNVLGGQGSIKDTAARLRCFRSVQLWEWALKDLMHNSSWSVMDNHQSELAEELAERKHLFCARPQTLFQVIEALDLDSIVPYQSGDATPVARLINRHLGFPAD